MSIQLDLDDVITFERPLTRVVKQNINIRNPHSQPITFKVKTTAPKLYCVRPNADIIQPNQSITVQVMLQAFKEEPPLDVKCRDKFLILSAFIPKEFNNARLQEIWSHLEANEKQNIYQHKLRCSYTQPASQESPNPPAEAPIQIIDTEEITEDEPVTMSNTPNDNIIENNDEQSSQVTEKMRQMEEELNKYKKEIENMRKVEPVVVEKVQVKTTGYPLSVLILVSLLIAAIAYFIKTKE
ncbi:PapD-like protein [Cokeromyces recurvatus]|uniref:PapD-like protein n=1 Tax=Cokeromyces recurvatus TaxID=90255 RepID=UPI00221FC562|nr:PapD-like protein [Cokeromyces recurvatus]KAI7906158.1 PapD-like protein [Cokeromyces recurvatus]